MGIRPVRGPVLALMRGMGKVMVGHPAMAMPVGMRELRDLLELLDLHGGEKAGARLQVSKAGLARHRCER